VVSSFTLPIVLISGVFGMNNEDLPEISFWIVIAIALSVSGILLLIYISISLSSYCCGDQFIRGILKDKKKEIESWMMEDLVSPRESDLLYKDSF